jgi:aspartate 1-decarboxylase
MIRTFLRSAIHNAIITGAWPISARIDPVLMQAAELREGEQVEILNIATGARFTTYVEPGIEGEVRVHGGRTGDVVSILCFGTLHDGQTLTHRAKVITVDMSNTIVSLVEMDAAR